MVGQFRSGFTNHLTMPTWMTFWWLLSLRNIVGKVGFPTLIHNVGKPTFPTMFLRVHEVDSVQTRSAHLFAQATSLIHAQGPMGFIIYINQLVLFFFHDTKQFKMIHTIYLRKKACFCHAMWNNMGLIFRSMTWIDGAVKFEQGLIAKLIYKIWIQYIWTRFVC